MYAKTRKTKEKRQNGIFPNFAAIQAKIQSEI